MAPSAAARRRAAAVGDGWIPLFLTVDEYGPALAALRRETVEAGRQPDVVTPAVVVFVHVGDDDDQTGAHQRGSQWLSELYGLPTKAFHRHLVAGPADACAAQLHRFARPGPATSSSWWPAPAPWSISPAAGRLRRPRRRPMPGRSDLMSTTA